MNATHPSYEKKTTPAILYSSSMIDRKYVHRQAINEVFITDLQQITDDHFMISAVLPKSHMYFNDHPRMANGKQYYDATLLLEIFRQTSICVTHKYYNVPFSTKFIFNDAKFNILNHHKLEITQEFPTASVSVIIINPKYRKNTLMEYTLEMTLSIDNIACAKNIMSIGWMAGRVWEKLRSKKEKQVLFNYSDIKPVNCLSVGRMVPRNVVIGNMKIKDGTLTTDLVVDQSYSSIFDHPLDHIPGMFIIEALRQTALMSAYILQDMPVDKLLFHDCDIRFQQFCELSSLSQCIVNLHKVNLIDELVQIAISISQNGMKNTTGIITFKTIN